MPCCALTGSREAAATPAYELVFTNGAIGCERKSRAKMNMRIGLADLRSLELVMMHPLHRMIERI
jgi:hypothetical protein